MRPAYSCLSPSKWLVVAASFAFGLLLSAAAPPARADDTTRAKELFQEGTTLFNIGDFDKAIEAWQAGYKEKPDPGFLYNIGQAYRLKGDAAKAIFFYRGYLRNSPRAANRAEVEAKIAALQKNANAGVNDHEPATPPPATPPPATPPPMTPPPVPPVRPTADTPPPPRPVKPAPTPVAPPPVVAPPLPVESGPPPGVVERPAPPPPPPAPTRNRPLDLSVGLGVDAWTSGVRGSAQPSFGFDVAVGYAFGGDVFGPASFRLGALVTSSFLNEGTGATKNKVTFTSWLLEPSVRIRLVDRRLYLTGGLGIGALAISNIRSTSSLLAVPPPGRSYDVSGTQGVFELRPSAGLQLHVTEGLVVFASPALSFSPKKTNFYQAIGRFEMMFGLAYLL